MNKIISFLLLGISANANAQVLRQRAVTLMGSRFDISIVAKVSATAEAYIDTAVKEVTRIEDLISDWRSYT